MLNSNIDFSGEYHKKKLCCFIIAFMFLLPLFSAELPSNSPIPPVAESDSFSYELYLFSALQAFTLILLLVVILINRKLRNDIDHQKRDLQEALLFPEDVIKSLPGVFYVYNKDLELIKWNENILKVTGFSNKELYHKKIFSWVNDEEKDLVKVLVDKVFEDGDVVMQEFDIVVKSGEALPFLVSLSSFFIDGERYLVGFGNDLTKRKHLEDQLRESHKMEAIGTLAGGIAHDFNNILAGIVGFTELAKLRSENDEEMQEYLSNILTASDRAKDIIKQILTFTKKEDSKKQPLDLVEIIDEVILLQQPFIPSSIKLSKNLEPVKQIHGDSSQIHQLVMNLVTNAYQAITNNKGLLTISLSEKAVNENDKLNLEGLPPGEFVFLEVIDSGEGMDSLTKENIFDPFFTTKGFSGGTGLGLSVVYGVVENHSGFIFCQSKLGKGTSFQVYFPVYEGGEVKKEKVSKAPEYGNKENIMYVDDESMITKFMKIILQKSGYSVEVFNNPKEALEEFRRNPDSFDLIITDIAMPELSGFELAEKILKIRKDIPVIMCSGNPKECKTDLDIKISSYISKPFNAVEVLGEISRVLADQ
jgi:PAS domain S-box-containing protein